MVGAYGHNNECKFDVQVWFINKSETKSWSHCYSGHGKYCKDAQEVAEYIEQESNIQ